MAHPPGMAGVLWELVELKKGKSKALKNPVSQFLTNLGLKNQKG